MTDKNSSMEFASWIAQLMDKKGGKGITVIDVRELSSITDFMVVVSGTSLKHLETLVEAPRNELKKSGLPVEQIEGRGTHWVVADFNDVVVHVFDESTRTYYDLEGLWASAPRLDWQSKKNHLHTLAL